MFWRKKKKPLYHLLLVKTYIGTRIFPLRGDWEIYDKDGEIISSLDNATRFQARKALKWWNQYGQPNSF